MNYWMAGWKAHARERRSHSITRQAYDNLVIAHRRALNELEEERARTAKAGQLLTEPCVLCEEMMRERDNAILELDVMEGEYRREQAGREVAEMVAFSGLRADGEPL